MKSRYTCPRCGSHNSRWARKLESGRWVCAKCYDELPFSEEPGKTSLVVDDMRDDVQRGRKK